MNKSISKHIFLSAGMVLGLCISATTSALAVETYTCPQFIICDLTNLSSPNCGSSIPNNWSYRSYTDTPNFKIDNPQHTRLMFMSAQSNSATSAAYTKCNYGYGDSSAFYAVSIMSTAYSAATGVLNIWQFSRDPYGNISLYCYSNSIVSFPPKDPTACPVE